MSDPIVHCDLPDFLLAPDDGREVGTVYCDGVMHLRYDADGVPWVAEECPVAKAKRQAS